MGAWTRVGKSLYAVATVILLFSPTVLLAENFHYSKTITIDHTKVPSTLSNFPLLVTIANDNDLKNHVTNPNGYDLVFKDAGGARLDHELEKWDPATGTLTAWVRIPMDFPRFRRHRIG